MEVPRMKRELKKQLKELQTAYPNSHLFPDEELDEAYIRYFHDGLLGSGKEYGISVYDLDEIAWLNTLDISCHGKTPYS